MSKTKKQKWTQQPPTMMGQYWHWNGDEDVSPLATYVMYSGTTQKCFVCMGQLGLASAIDCDEYGGWWMPMIIPDTPKIGAKCTKK